MIDYQSTTPQERAIFRAVVEGVKVRRGAGDDVWYVSSSSRPGQTHCVENDQCDCEAAEAGRYCKHRAAVAMVKEPKPCSKCGWKVAGYLLDDNGLCYHCQPVERTCRHCKHTGYDVKPDPVTFAAFCENRQSCWSRYDVQNGLRV